MLLRDCQRLALPIGFEALSDKDKGNALSKLKSLP